MGSRTLIISFGLLASVFMVVLGILELVGHGGVFWVIVLGWGVAVVVQNTRLLLRKPNCRRD